MPALSVTLTLDTSEMRLLVAEYRARVTALGFDECERRLGRPLDDAFCSELFVLASAGQTRHGACAYRLAPTAYFKTVLGRLRD